VSIGRFAWSHKGGSGITPQAPAASSDLQHPRSGQASWSAIASSWRAAGPIAKEKPPTLPRYLRRRLPADWRARPALACWERS